MVARRNRKNKIGCIKCRSIVCRSGIGIKYELHTFLSFLPLLITTQIA